MRSVWRRYCSFDCSISVTGHLRPVDLKVTNVLSSRRSLLCYADTLEVYLIECTRFTPSIPAMLSPGHSRARGWHVLQRGSTGTCACGRNREAGHTLCSKCRVALRGRLRAPCVCGGPYFAADVCRPCYFRAYNKTRVRVKAVYLLPGDRCHRYDEAG